MPTVARNLIMIWAHWVSVFQFLLSDADSCKPMVMLCLYFSDLAPQETNGIIEDKELNQVSVSVSGVCCITNEHMLRCWEFFSGHEFVVYN